MNNDIIECPDASESSDDTITHVPRCNQVYIQSVESRTGVHHVMPASFSRVVRIVSLQKESRVVHHMHFTSFDDKTRPSQIYPLVAFRQRVKRLEASARGPMVVHCRWLASVKMFIF